MIRFNDWTIDRRTLTISYAGRVIRFNERTHNGRFTRNRRFMVMEHLALADGMATPDTIWDLLYANRDDGGPISYRNMVDVLLCHLKPNFENLGVQLVRERRAGIRHFRLEDVV